MQKPQIIWRNQTPQASSIKRGWTHLSQNKKLWLMLANLVWLCLVFYNFSQKDSLLALLSGLYPPLLFSLFVLHANGFPKKSVGSLLAELKAENGTVWVGDYQLPETVNKVVIGRIDIQGPAYLQLAWNQGHQWVFQLDELQQVRHFFRQHAPQIEIVNE